MNTIQTDEATDKAEMKETILEPAPIETASTPAVEEETPDHPPLPRSRDAIPLEEEEGWSPLSMLNTGVESIHRREMQQHWLPILTDNPDSIPHFVREAAGVEGAELSAEEKEEQLLRTVNQSWLADHSDKKPEEIRNNWSEMRRQFSTGRQLANTEQEMFHAISAEQKRELDEELASELYFRGYQHGLEGKELGSLDALLQLKKSKNDRARQIYIENYTQQAFERGAKERERLLPIAEQLAVGMDAMVDAEQRIFSPELFSQAAPSAKAASSQMRRLSAEERKNVFYLALAQREQMKEGSGGEDEGLTSQLLRSAKRGATNVGFDLGLGALHLSAGAMDALGGLVDSEGLKDGAEDVDLRARVANEIRQVAQQQQAPLYIPEDTELSEQFLIDMAGGTPQAVMGFGGVASWGTLIASGIGSSISQARERNSAGDLPTQTAAGIMAAGIQEAISFGFTRVGGRVFERSLDKFARAKGRGIGSYSLATLSSGGLLTAETAKMAVEQKIGTLADLGLHELSSHIDKSNSNIDWQSYGDNFADIESNMREAAMNLPYLLIGAGRAQLHHFAAANEIKNNAAALEEWGIAPERIEDILQESDPMKANQLLQDALTQSSRWSGANFLRESMQSLKLMNTDYFDGFKDAEIVCDFLGLPPEIASLPQSQVQLGDPDAEGAVERLQEKHGDVKGSKIRLGKSLQIWDYWWEKSNVERFIPEKYRQDSVPVRMKFVNDALRQRQLRYQQDVKKAEPILPRQLLRGFYHPTAEKERRLVLRDRMAELHDLSYQYLLNISPPEMLQHKSNSMEGIIARQDRVRKGFLIRVANEVLERASGRSRAESHLSLQNQLFKNYRHVKLRSQTPYWIKKVSLTDFRNLQNYAMMTENQLANTARPPEFLHAARLLVGMESSADYLYELLPEMDDFQRALGRGMTPLQAYSEILTRELDIDADFFKEYKLDFVNKQASNTDLKILAQQHQLVFDNYSMSTGYPLESSEGLEGKSYWRTQLPDGSPTRWHETREQAINDLMLSTASLFYPLAESNRERQERMLSEEEYRLIDYLPDSKESFSPFDQLGMQGFFELYEYNTGSVARGLPGLRFERFHNRVTPSRSLRMLEITPFDRTIKQKTRYQMDELSVTTPYALMRTRAHAYWKGVLNDTLLQPEEIHSMLSEADLLSTPELVQLFSQDGLKEPINDSLSYYTNNDDDHYGRFVQRRENLALVLADISTDYVIANMDDYALPPSVKTWLRLAPLSPTVPDSFAPQQYAVGYRRRPLMRSNNRNTAERLKLRADIWDTMRKKKDSITASSLLPFIDASLGYNNQESYERSWSHFYGSQTSTQTQQTGLWNLINYPKTMWPRLPAVRQQVMYDTMQQYYSHLPNRETVYESLDNFGQALDTLGDVLIEYPELHEVALSLESEDKILRLQLDDPTPEQLTLSEPHYKRIDWEIPSSDHLGYRPDEMIDMPDSFREDARIIPSLRLLGDLRRYHAQTAISNETGIWWRGERYGKDANTLPGMGDNWSVERPLSTLERHIEAIQSRIAEQGGEPLRIMDYEFTALPETLNWESLGFASLFRDKNYPTDTLRLMPANEFADNPIEHSPYTIRARGGIYYDRIKAIQDDEGYRNRIRGLDYFKTYKLNWHNEETNRALAQDMAQRLTNRVLREIDSKDTAEGVEAGYEKRLEDLLITLAEDTGFSYDIRNKSIEEMTPPQLLLLKLNYELAKVVYGSQPEEDLRSLAEFVRKNFKSEKQRSRFAFGISDIIEKQYRESENAHAEAVNKGILPKRIKSGRRPKQKETQKRRSFRATSGGFWGINGF